MTKIHDDIQDDRLIIGVLKDGQVYTEEFAVYFLKENSFDQVIFKQLAEVMATSDDKNAKKWNIISKASPLLGVLDSGEFCFVKGGLFKPSANDLH